MAVRTKRTSYLRFSDLVVIDGYEFWDTSILPDAKIKEARDGDIDYEVQSTDRIDRLAFNFYGDPVLWWVIAVSNDMEDLPTALVTGQTIRIPDPRYVKERLFTTSTRGS